MKRRSFLAFLTGTLAALGLVRVSARSAEPIAPPVDHMGDPRAWNPWHPNPEPPIGPGPVWRVYKDFDPTRQRKRVLDVIAERDLREREALDARHVASERQADG